MESGTSKNAINQALYNLYDNNKIKLDDVEHIPPTFAGSKVFGYKVGTGTNDTELGFFYSAGVDKSDIQFCNFLNEDSIPTAVEQLQDTIITNSLYILKLLLKQLIMKSLKLLFNLSQQVL